MLETHQSDFINTLNKIAPHKHRFDVFKDFVVISAISLHNATRFSQELEDEYFTIIKSYSKEDLRLLAKLLGILTHILESKPYDALGQLYMALGFGDARKGQFFTPPHICELMAELGYGDKIQNSDDNDDFITLSEPACGGGGFILAFAHKLIKNGDNPADKLWVEAIDIDRTTALMCYLQLSLWNIPARVIVGNALTLEMQECFYTPAHYLYFWEARLQRKMDKVKESKSENITDNNAVNSDEMVAETHAKVFASNSSSLAKSKQTNEGIDSATPQPQRRIKRGVASGQLTLFDF
jgi:hypothetical protein